MLNDISRPTNYFEIIINLYTSFEQRILKFYINNVKDTIYER